MDGPPMRNGRGIWAVVCAVFSLLFMVVFAPLGLILGGAALALGASARGRVVRGEADNGGQAVIAMVIGMVGAVISIAFLVHSGIFVAGHTAQINQLTHCLAQAKTSHARSVCQHQFSNAVHTHG
ncbi:MAG TPA: hypothetical protein VE152_03805 [Acidimicrobiales bacterium]|nr:hypothetical protein [Acidimicrobiales bacterium]